MKYVRYAWNVLQWAVYALIAWYVLGQLHGRPEALIVPILGILYCGQSFFAGAMITMLTGMNVMLNETVRQLKQLGAGSYLTTESAVGRARAIEGWVEF